MCKVNLIIDKSWLMHYECAKEYYEKNGNLKIAQARIVNGLKLGKWLHLQKVAYKSGALTNEQIVLMESIGFVWNEKEAQWMRSYNCAKAYYDKHGNLNVPSGYSVDGIFLGIWVSSQRTSYNRGTLSKERKKLLDAIGMNWIPRASRCKKKQE